MGSRGKQPRGCCARGRLLRASSGVLAQPRKGEQKRQGLIMSTLLCRVLQGNLATQAPWAHRDCL